MESKCQIGIKLHDICPDNCKSIQENNPWQERLAKECIAVNKLDGFIDGSVSLSVAMAAFHQCPVSRLVNFAQKSLEHIDLLNYFLNISEIEKARITAETFTESLLADLFRMEYENFKKMRGRIYSKKDRIEKNFFNLKGHVYWSKISHSKICNLIRYFIQKTNEPFLASQFLVILPPFVVSKLDQYTGLNREEEKNLYLALGDEIYELPLQSPSLYSHMVDLFSEDFEINLYLTTMEELIKRQVQVFESTQNLINYFTENSIELSIQKIYDEVVKFEKDLSFEILNRLMEKQVLTLSQRDTILKLLETKSLT